MIDYSALLVKASQFGNLSNLKYLLRRFHPCRSYHAHTQSRSLGPDQVNEYASVVVLQVGRLVGEVGEVVTHASLQVLADVMVDRG